MKYAIVIPDGCADEPQASLGGMTPLQAAKTPAMDEIARRGLVGRANHVPPHLPAGSDVANLSLFGYDPCAYFTGRAPIEAAAQGIQLGPNDWAIRCNLVTVLDQHMKSFTAGQVSTAEARGLLGSMNEIVDRTRFEFVPGVSYRNLLLLRGRPSEPAPFSQETRTVPPHDLTDQSVVNDFPRGPGSDLLADLMAKSETLFADHVVNRARRRAGKLPATTVWLWGLGKTPAIPTFHSLHKINGAMITAVDLLRGLAALMGWKRIEVPGATGYLDTDYGAKGRYAIEALDSTDLICVHVEATDEASHEGSVHEKILALERIDEAIVAPLLHALDKRGEPFRIMVTPDHPTPVRTKTHSHGFVPLAICGQGLASEGFASYDEISAEKSNHSFPDGWRLMEYFLRG